MLVVAIVVVIAALVALGYRLVHGVTFDVLQPTGVIGLKERNLLLFTLGLSLIVVVPVFTMLAVFAWKYHESNTEATYKPNWTKNTTLETIWWGIPIVIIAILSLVTFITSHTLDPYKPIASNNRTIEVQVVALQWKWLFIYPDYGIATVNELPIAVNTPIHFSLTGDAPMNGFWIPSLGTQIYAMNGMQSELNLMANKVGVYKGHATNINGKGYADMNFTVKALSSGDFDTWQKSAHDSPDQLTKATYDKLAEPNTMGVRTLLLADRTLYDTIMMKYMTKQTTKNNTTKSTMDHHSMDAM